MLKGATQEYFNPLSWASFGRTSWTQPEGSVPAFIHEARVFNVNMTNWTVDVQTIFDQKVMLDVQVSSPYMHPNTGEGLYAVPEVGSKCLIAIPSDGPPPVVLSFIMPVITTQDTGSDEAPRGTAPNGGDPEASAGDFNYGGGRSRGKPGDIVARGRDGNFMILHRGGVAQFGSGPLAQRICVPLQNLITDISQNYNHFNGAGSINWGVQDRGNSNPGAEYRMTHRVYANDEYADIRMNVGRVRAPVPEPTGSAGETSNLNQLNIGTDEEVVYEFVLARGGFESDAGEFKGKASDVKLRMFFDRGGSAMARFEGSVDLRVKKKLRITVDQDVQLFCKGNVSMQSDGKLDLTGNALASIGTKGGSVTVNGGSKAVAHVGSRVKVAITVPVAVMVQDKPPPAPPSPGVIVSGQILEGVVLSGNPTILV
jgi:hypothetical protein